MIKKYIELLISKNNEKWKNAERLLMVLVVTDVRMLAIYPSYLRTKQSLHNYNKK